MMNTFLTLFKNKYLNLYKNSFIYIITFIAIINSACSSKTDNNDKTVFNINFEIQPSSLDPAFSRSQINNWAINQLFNGLVQLDSQLVVQPAIAKSYNIEDNGKTYIFNLRTDVYFHDSEVFENGEGRKVNANDFVFSFNRIIDKKTASSGAWIFNDKINDNPFKAINDSTFAIYLNQPFPSLLSLLTSQYCSVIPSEAIDKYGKDFRNNPVGTGPFCFKYWKEGEVLVLIKNNNYWERKNGVRLPFLDAVKITFIADKQTAFMEFMKGNLDFFNGLDGSFRDEIITKEGKLISKYESNFKMLKSPYLNTEYLGINMDSATYQIKNSPLHKLKFRQAINYAINRKKMIQYLRNNIGNPNVKGFIPYGTPNFNQDNAIEYEYNPKKAALLLAEIGHPNGKNLAPIKITTTAAYKDIVEFIQKELDNIGIIAEIEIQQGSALRELVSNRKVPFFRASWIADFPDAENYMSVFYSKNKAPNGPNYTLFNNHQFDLLYEKAQQELDLNNRNKLFSEMNNIVTENSPIIILFYDEVINFYQNNITGYQINAINLLTLKEVRKN